jgi:beta-galactosidase/beta-glucuronidase
VCAWQGLKRVDGRGRLQWAYGTDFGDPFSAGHGQFCINGVVFPDRVPHPGLIEAKALQQPLHFSPAHSEASTLSAFAVRLENRYDFVGLEHLAASWAVRSDGGELASGTLPLPAVPPHQTAEVRVDLSVAAKEAKARGRFWSEAWLELRAVLKADTPWAAKGHALAVAQLPLPAQLLPPPTAPPKAPKGGALAVEEQAGGGALRVRGEGWSVGLDRATGRLEGWEVGGDKVMELGPRHCFLRAHTDNDRAGFPVSATMMFDKGLCDALEPVAPWEG